MAKNKSPKSYATQNRERQMAEAEQIAKGIREDGQSKEQTRAVARGIAKGIALYKKQHKAKVRTQAKASASRDAARLRAAEISAGEAVQARRRPVAAMVFALGGWLVLAALVAALIADVLAVRGVTSRLAAANGAQPVDIVGILPDVTPVGRLRRGILLDVTVLCADGRLRYDLAGLSFAGRVVLTDPDQTQAISGDCAVTVRD